MPNERRSTSSSLESNVAPTRGWKTPWLVDEPSADAFVSGACEKPGPANEQGVPAGSPSKVSSMGSPPFTPGLTHMTAFHALNQNARAAPPAVGGTSNAKRS